MPAVSIWVSLGQLRVGSFLNLLPVWRREVRNGHVDVRWQSIKSCGNHGNANCLELVCVKFFSQIQRWWKPPGKSSIRTIRQLSFRIFDYVAGDTGYVGAVSNMTLKLLVELEDVCVTPLSELDSILAVAGPKT